MTKTSYLKENDETVLKFTRALKKAQDWVQKQDAAEIAKTIQPYFEDADPAIMKMSIQRYKEQGSYAADPILDEEEWDNLQNIMDEAGELPSRMEYTKLVNVKYAEKVSQ